MVWNKQRMKVWVTMCVMAVVMTACSISYQFNGSSIDYTKRNSRSSPPRSWSRSGNRSFTRYSARGRISRSTPVPIWNFRASRRARWSMPTPCRRISSSSGSPGRSISRRAVTSRRNPLIASPIKIIFPVDCYARICKGK